MRTLELDLVVELLNEAGFELARAAVDGTCKLRCGRLVVDGVTVRRLDDPTVLSVELDVRAEVAAEGGYESVERVGRVKAGHRNSPGPERVSGVVDLESMLTLHVSLVLPAESTDDLIDEADRVERVEVEGGEFIAGSTANGVDREEAVEGSEGHVGALSEEGRGREGSGDRDHVEEWL